jgi:predicted TIM-barrel fold metal-dependent hydrolase
MKIIDAHIHFSNREGFKTTAREIGCLEYSARGLQKELKQSSVIAAVAMSTPSRDERPNCFPDEFIQEDGMLDCVFSCVGVNPEKLSESSDELFHIEEELKKNQVVGIKLYAGYFPYYVHDALYEPVYALARKYEVPVAIHCGDTQSSGGLLKYSHPLTIDELAVNYPDINFIICHMGIPWVLDTAELISKNKNVYTDKSGLISGSKKQIRRMKRERYYVDLIRQALVYADRYDKVLFGSDWPLMPIGSYIDYIKHVVPKRHWEEVFFQNALAVFPKMELALHML